VDQRPTFSLNKQCEPIGSDAAPMAENVQREIAVVTYCGSDRQVNEGFAIALRIMRLDTNFPPVALATKSPNTEDN
jgi:hypothetical protein